jgi:hypothetical protein
MTRILLIKPSPRMTESGCLFVEKFRAPSFKGGFVFDRAQ